MAFTTQPVSGYGFSPQTFDNGVTVRNIREDDADFAGRLTVEAFESKCEHAVGKNNMETVIKASQEELRYSGAHYKDIFIAEVDGMRAGLLQLKYNGYKHPGSSDYPNGQEPWSHYLSCWPLCRLICMSMFLDEKMFRKGDCYVDHICVDQHYRGRGVGKRLMEVADQEALKHNCNTIFLWVYGENRAQHLYERQGYVAVDRKSGCCVKCWVGMSPFVRMDKNLCTS